MYNWRIIFSPFIVSLPSCNIEHYHRSLDLYIWSQSWVLWWDHWPRHGLVQGLKIVFCRKLDRVFLHTTILFSNFFQEIFKGNTLAANKMILHVMYIWSAMSYWTCRQRTFILEFLWSSWSPCSAFCGKGLRNRHTMCGTVRERAPGAIKTLEIFNKNNGTNSSTSPASTKNYGKSHLNEEL